MAGYNNYFPQNYNGGNMYTPYAYGGPSQITTMGQTQPAQSTVNAINWVQGEAGAKSVPVPAGQKVLLMDSETNVFYVKSSDVSGMPLPLRIFEYKEVDKESQMASQNDRPQSTYVTREEFDEVIAELKSKTVPMLEEKKNNEFVI